MESLIVLWIIQFFFVILILIFLWSKMLIISNKLNNLAAVVEKSDHLESNPAIDGKEKRETP